MDRRCRTSSRACSRAACASSCAHSIGRICSSLCVPRAMRRASSPSALRRTKAKAASSIARRDGAQRNWPRNFQARGGERCHITPASTIRPGRETRMSFCRMTESLFAADDRFRHGHRQAGRALCVSCRHAILDRGLLSGDRACGCDGLARRHVYALRRGDTALRRRQIAEGNAPDERKRVERGKAGRSRGALRIRRAAGVRFSSDVRRRGYRRADIATSARAACG